MLDRYTTGPRKAKYIRWGKLGSDERLPFPDHKALDYLSHASLVDASGDVSGYRLQSRRRVAHRHSKTGPGDHLLIIRVVPDRADLCLRDLEAVRNHGEGARFGYLWVDDLPEPVEGARHAGDVAHPGGQLCDAGRNVGRVEIKEHHLRGVLTEPLRQRNDTLVGHIRDTRDN